MRVKRKVFFESLKKNGTEKKAPTERSETSLFDLSQRLSLSLDTAQGN